MRGVLHTLLGQAAPGGGGWPSVFNSAAYWYGTLSDCESDDSGTPSGDGGYVKHWTDMLGGNGDATTIDNVRRPVLDTTGTPSGKPALYFDNVASEHDSLNPGNYNINSTPYTVMVAYKPRTTTGNHRVVNGSFQNFLIGVRSGYHAAYANGFISENHASAAANVGTWVVCTVKVGSGGNAALFRVNGVDCTQSNTPSGTPDIMYIGGLGAFIEGSDADVAHVVVWHGVSLTLTDIQDAENYLMDDIGI